jgi:hypothetical protein
LDQPIRNELNDLLLIDLKKFFQQLEQLYIEVLYTIRHKIGAHSAQYPHHYKEDLIRYAQSAFNFGSEQHRRCQAIASEEKVRI